MIDIPYIKDLMEKQELHTYWAVAVAYNCGYSRFVSQEGPPLSAVDYGCRVMERWKILEGNRYINPLVRRGI
jgi:hypothetical protein